MTRWRQLPELIVAAPGVGLALVVLLALVGQQLGVAPFVPGRTVTLAEAAALEDEADIVRLVGAGADPNAPSFVRRTRLRAVHRAMTPLEAAAGTRHASVVQVLLEAGARIDARNFPQLWCAAETARSDEVLALLRKHQPAGALARCDAARATTTN